MSENEYTPHKDIADWVGLEEEQTVLPTTLSRREQWIHSLAHVRLQQNGHDKYEAMQWATAQAEKYLDEE